VYNVESQTRAAARVQPVEKVTEITLPAKKTALETESVKLSSSMDALQNKLNDLRVSCGTVVATVSQTTSDVHIDADQLVHCVNIHDY
jgi:SMC interacting uncharacterized protein involved in chromosome segregation